MQHILEAIKAGASSEEISNLKIPESYRAVYVKRDEADIFEGRESWEKDPRESIHVSEVATPDLAPDEACLAVMASSINFNTVWTSIFEPLPTFGFLDRLGKESEWGARHALDHHVLGSDACGVIIQTGSAVRNWKPGDRVNVHCNYVDDQGQSLDQQGAVVDIKDYFLSNGKVNVDKQREHTYVQILSKKIISEYYKNNRVYSSHLVAFTAFKMLERKNSKLDLYSILRLSEDDLTLDYEAFKINFKKLRGIILVLNEQGKVDVNDKLKNTIDESIIYGLNNIGMYHAKRPLIKSKDQILILNASTLYYYHNRLEGYGLEKHI